MTPDDYRRLVAAGLNPEQVALVMEMMAAQEAVHVEAEEARKAKGRDRVAKWRAQRNVTEMQPNVTELLVRDRVAPVDDKQKPIDTNTSQNTTSKDHSEFRAVLASLDGDRLTAIIKHRKSKKAQITGHAARLFLKDVDACGLSLADAVDTCISRNWITVKPDWLNKPQARGSPPQQQAPQMADVFQFIVKNFSNDPGSEHDDSRSARQALSYLPAGGSQRCSR